MEGQTNGLSSTVHYVNQAVFANIYLNGDDIVLKLCNSKTFVAVV